MGKSSRRATAVRTVAQGQDIPVVGMREPCPCGSGKRYKLCHGLAARQESTTLVTRPFEGLPGEADWVALREIVPAASAVVRTTAAHGAREVTISTVLPMAWPALHRADGAVLVGLQTGLSSSDASRDVANALLAALAAEPGVPVLEGVAPTSSPRLQEVLDLTVPFEVTVHPGFDYWLAEDADRTAEVRDSLEAANAAVIPTLRLSSVAGAYWASVGSRRHLRWVMAQAEDELLDALARLHEDGGLSLVEGSRYVGAFRAAGLVVPVWDLPVDIEAADLEKPAVEFEQRLQQALAETTPLTAAQRGARAGVVSRQLTLR